MKSIKAPIAMGVVIAVCLFVAPSYAAASKTNLTCEAQWTEGQSVGQWYEYHLTIDYTAATVTVVFEDADGISNSISSGTFAARITDTKIVWDNSSKGYQPGGQLYNRFTLNRMTGQLEEANKKFKESSDTIQTWPCTLVGNEKPKF